MRSSEYTPFFVPEFGWVFIALMLAALLSEINGSAERHTRKNLRPDAPFLLLRMIAITFIAAGVAIGVGLLIQSEGVAKAGLWTAVPLMAAFWLIAQRYKTEKRGSGPSPGAG
jgi:hypothetical protein